MRREVDREINIRDESSSIQNLGQKDEKVKEKKMQKSCLQIKVSNDKTYNFQHTVDLCIF